MKHLLLFGGVFGQIFSDLEIDEGSLPFNETCDSPENGKMCENQCWVDLQACANSCQDQACIGPCQRVFYSCIDGNFRNSVVHYVVLTFMS